MGHIDGNPGSVGDREVAVQVDDAILRCRIAD